MTRNELDEILHQCYSVEIFPEEAAELIWGQFFEGETERITKRDDAKPVDLVTKSASLPNLIGTTLAYAQAGDAQAQYNLGNAYAFGDGVAEDAVEAVKWWRKAAEQGYAKAQCSIGNAYYCGDGVPQDKVESARWYALAHSQHTTEEAQ